MTPRDSALRTHLMFIHPSQTNIKLPRKVFQDLFAVLMAAASKLNDRMMGDVAVGNFDSADVWVH